jgi:hypothetical protein
MEKSRVEFVWCDGVNAVPEWSERGEPGRVLWLVCCQVRWTQSYRRCCGSGMKETTARESSHGVKGCDVRAAGVKNEAFAILPH